MMENVDIIKDKYGLEKDSYILSLGRIVPEKGLQYLIEAFKNCKTDKKLVIAGGSESNKDYYCGLCSKHCPANSEYKYKDNTVTYAAYQSMLMSGRLNQHAMSQYQALPNHYMKALGVEKNPDPLPGSLDVLQCRNGIDTIVEDYKTVPGWNNPYVQNHVVQPLQGALAVQDVELSYELPDTYFHIQTCDDGFDYTRLRNKIFRKYKASGYAGVEAIFERDQRNQKFTWGMYDRICGMFCRKTR